MDDFPNPGPFRHKAAHGILEKIRQPGVGNNHPIMASALKQVADSLF